MTTIHVTDAMFQSILGHDVSTITTFCDVIPCMDEKIRIVANSGRYMSENDMYVTRYVISVNDITDLTDDEKICRLTVSAVALPF